MEFKISHCQVKVSRVRTLGVDREVESLYSVRSDEEFSLLRCDQSRPPETFHLHASLGAAC